MNLNPNCDGEHCLYEHGEVRLLPYCGDGNMILCLGCFNHEIAYRRRRNEDEKLDPPFELPVWTSLKVYEVPSNETPALLSLGLPPNLSEDKSVMSLRVRRSV